MPILRPLDHPPNVLGTDGRTMVEVRPRFAEWVASTYEDIYPMQTSLPYGGPKPPLVLSDLSERERDILAMVCDGWVNSEIGEHFGVAPNSISNYVTAISEKLQAKNRAHLAALAIRSGIIESA